MRDAVRPERRNRSLTQEDVRLIRELLQEREDLIRRLDALTYRAIGDKFEVSYNLIWHIHKGNIYRDVQ